MNLHSPITSTSLPVDATRQQAELKAAQANRNLHHQQLHAHADLERREDDFEARMRSLPLSELGNISGDFGLSIHDGRMVLNATGNDLQKSSQPLNAVPQSFSSSMKPLAEENSSPVTRVDLRHLPPR